MTTQTTTLSAKQNAKMQKLTWVSLAAAFAGMLVAVTFDRLTRTNSGFLPALAPFIVLIVMIPGAYRQGVRDATQRE